MSTKIILYVFSLCFFFISDTIEDPLYCLIEYDATSVCVICNQTEFRNNECLPIKATTKAIISRSDINISYEQYAKRDSAIQLIEEPTKITFYTCPKHHNSYLQVSSENYYPINSTMNVFVPSIRGNNPAIMKDNFQKCLEQYCYNHPQNIFQCLQVKRLDFNFNTIITVSCIQNITYAFLLFVDDFNEIRPNYFFKRATNLIYLELKTANLKTIACSTFMAMKRLRVLRIDSRLMNSNYKTKCLFTHNWNLVRVTINGFSTWRDSCNPMKQRPITTLVLILLSLSALFLFVIICSIIVYIRDKFGVYDDSNSSTYRRYSLSDTYSF